MGTAPRRFVALVSVCLGTLVSAPLASAAPVGDAPPESAPVGSFPAHAASTTQGWSQGSSLPPEYVTHWDVAYAYFPPSNEVVLFGGSPKQWGESWSNETWLFANGSWSLGPAAPAGLTPRGGGAMAYDPQLNGGSIVMFGGAGPSWPPSNETWIFDGSGWSQGPDAPKGLSGRTGAQMVYDTDMGKIVLFGGTGEEPYADTWVFTGTRWREGPVSPAGMGPRAFFGMSFDPNLGVVAAGGDGGTDTWVLTGTSMSTLQWSPGPAMPPALGARERFRLDYDRELNGSVLFGGLDYKGDSDLWVLEGGANWVQIPRSGPWPAKRVDGSMLWNPDGNGGGGALMLFGGLQSKRSAGFSDTWFYNGSPPTAPPDSPVPVDPIFPSASTVPYVPPTGPADGQITAQAGGFYLNGQQIILKGANDNPKSDLPSLQQKAGWGMNLIRLRVHWAELEPTGPTQNPDGSWTHQWDLGYLNSIETFVNNAYLSGLYVLIDMHGCDSTTTCGYFGLWPDWSATAQYDSTGVTYDQTSAGKEQAQADFWSDDNRRMFFSDAWEFLAGNLSGTNGVAGYELQNEPQRGTLPERHSTTRTILDALLTVGQDVRTIDPSRMIVFTTRADYGPGLVRANLTGWCSLGNVAFDLHDYFGARWGSGVNLTNPASNEYDETQGALYRSMTIGTSNGGKYPYIGTTFNSIRYMQHRVDLLNQACGIPVLVGEIGDLGTDAGVYWAWATTLDAANYMGLSWAVDDGPLGFMGQPWKYLVLDAI